MKLICIFTVLIVIINITSYPVSGQTMSLDYSTYLGGNSADYAEGIVLNTDGKIYTVGYTQSLNFPTANPYQPGNDGYYDAFVAIVTSSGSALYCSTYIGGNSEDYGEGIAVGSDGIIYLGGYTQSLNFPTANPYQAGNKGYYDAFVAILSSGGSSLLYSTYLGGSSADSGRGIGLGEDGKIFLAGSTESLNFPVMNAYQATNQGVNDAFVTAFSSAGSYLTYSTYLGGSDEDYGRGISLGMNDSVYLTGETQSFDFPLENPFQSSLGGAPDAFISAVSSSGSTLYYSTYLGGNGADYGEGICLGTSGNAFITGFTQSFNFPTENAYQPAKSGDYDTFVTTLAPAGSTLIYSSYIGGSNEDYGRAICIDNDGSAYVTGETQSYNFPTENAYQGVNRGYPDVYLFKLSSSGSSLLYSSYLGGTAEDYGKGVGLGPDGSVYFTGRTFSFNFPVQESYQSSNEGYCDIFISKFGFPSSPTPPITPSPSLSPTSSITPSPTISPTPSPSLTLSVTPPPTYPPTPSPSPTLSVTPSPTNPPTPSPSPTLSVTPSPTNPPTPSPSPILSVTPPPTYSPTPSPSPTPSSTQTPTVSSTPTPATTPTIALTPTPGLTPTSSPGVTATPTPAETTIPTPSIFPTPDYLVLASADYTGDGVSDIAIFRPGSGLWAVRGLGETYFGKIGDLPVGGDYDGDGMTDVAIFRPSSGLWAVKRLTRAYFGSQSDQPVPGDYDGDGTCDMAYFRESDGTWRIRGVTLIYYGQNDDLPVPADYEGDRSVDVAIFRPNIGLWAVRGITRVYYGSAGDRPVPGIYRWYLEEEYAGSPFRDMVGIYRHSVGLWAIRHWTRYYFGSSSDLPLVGGYTGDAIDNTGIFRPATGLWALREETRVYYGRNGDLPLFR